MNEITIYSDCEFFTAFPDPEKVFSSELEKRLLLPLGIYKLGGNIESDVLLAIPLGNEEGLLGINNIGGNCGELWLTYTNRNGKWSVDCTESDLHSFEHFSEVAREMFQETKESFKRDGYITSLGDISSKLPLFHAGGNITSFSNCFCEIQDSFSHSLFDIPGNEDSLNKYVRFFDKSGNEYIYIGFSEGINYSHRYMPNFHFFYKKETKTALVISEF
ncbi:hypothetical protein [Hahella sp. NBU794]|uniref:hypothetical protein n=1 Tax=Hahella sp. NBU794 TaxID=3422590 RepID=UPI003D6DF1B3